MWIFRTCCNEKTLDWLESLSVEVFQNMSFDDCCQKLSKEIVQKLNHAYVEEIMFVYKNYGMEKLVDLRASSQMKSNGEKKLKNEDMAKRIPDGEILNKTLQKMGYSLREREGEMDKFWKFTPSDAILTEPVLVDGNLKCPTVGCPFISTRSKIIRHLTEKHPKTLKFYFD